MIHVQHSRHPYLTTPVTGEQYDAIVAYDAALARHHDENGTYDGAPEPPECIAGITGDVALPPVVVSEREASEWAAMLADSEQEESDRRDIDFSRGLVAP